MQSPLVERSPVNKSCSSDIVVVSCSETHKHQPLSYRCRLAALPHRDLCMKCLAENELPPFLACQTP